MLPYHYYQQKPNAGVILSTALYCLMWEDKVLILKTPIDREFSKSRLYSEDSGKSAVHRFSCALGLQSIIRQSEGRVGGVRLAAPLAATQDTSGEGRQDPCPVLQPTAQPASRLQLRENPLRRAGKTASHRGKNVFILLWGRARKIKSATIDSVWGKQRSSMREKEDSGWDRRTRRQANEEGGRNKG